MSIFEEPLLICEAGLHGDGDIDYYLKMVESIRGWWTGWPRIAFKVQYYIERGPRVMETLPGPALRELGHAVEAAGLLYAITPHDHHALDIVAATSPDILKLGSFGAADREMRKAARQTGLPLVLSTGQLPGSWLPEDMDGYRDAVGLQCISAYPANAIWDPHNPGGYSCHAVPNLACDYCPEAAERGCQVIELHITAREAWRRPQPKDYCVSYPLEKFRMLAEDIGRHWAAEPLRIS